MGNSHFKADSWLNSNHSPPPKHFNMGSTNPSKQNTQKNQHDNKLLTDFFPSNFLITGWRGESLTSKSATHVEKVLHDLIQETKDFLKHSYQLTKSLKLAIYNEFLSYASTENINCNEIDSYSTFWKHLQSKNSSYQDIINNFLLIYSFRVVTIYLFKVRFIIKLCKEISITPTKSSLLNTSFFFEKIFKKGSSTELLCESLQSNHYSWYRPSEAHQDAIYDLTKHLHLISISEMMKICRYNPSASGTDQEKNNTETSQYSHSLSHKSFGLFINNLIVYLPHWFNNSNPLDPSKKNIAKTRMPNVLNCKFAGNHLSSIILSHWLAQENNLYVNNDPWNELLCPDFIENDFLNGRFIKICHELQFLTFLVQMAIVQKYDPIKFICSIMKEKYSNAEVDHRGQISLFPKYEFKRDLLYDRIILNLSKLPKKNPHHFLLAKVNTQLKSLSENAFLFVFTNQRLFVPSQSEKIQQLLQQFKLEVHFDFEGLKGRGEIPSYLHVFSKRSSSTSVNLENTVPTTSSENDFKSFINSPPIQKESCLTFRWHGELVLFNKFSQLVNELEHFWETKSSQTTPLYHKNIDKKLFFEFHQDAIVEGKLIHSSPQDPSHVTHPNFFKNLTKSCIHFDNFFQIEQIRPQEEDQDLDILTSGFLGINLKQEEKYPLILIVNYSDPTQIKLELSNSDSYRAKLEEYGMAFFQYFGLIPKEKNVNINLFREYFKTNIGSQIIQLSLNGGLTKVKAKLRSLLIPKFFIQAKTMPQEIEKRFFLLKSSPSELLTIHPDELEKQFTNIENLMSEKVLNWPWQIMGLLSYFKLNLKNCIQDFEVPLEAKKNNMANFHNPFVIDSLLKAKSSPIYPKNPEVWIDIKTNDPRGIHLPLTKIIQKKDEDNHFLELYSDDLHIVNIYSPPTLLSFIYFILNANYGIKFSSLLQSLKVPKEKDLVSIINNFRCMKDCFEILFDKSSLLINQILTQQIFTHSN